MWWGCVKNIGNLDKRVKNGSDCRSRERMERQRKERGWGAPTLKKSGGG